MSKYSKAYFNPYSDSFSCRVAIVSPEVLQEAEQRLSRWHGISNEASDGARNRVSSDAKHERNSEKI